MTTSSPFLAVPRPRPDAKCRLYMFHHAGGSFSIFRALAAHLPAWVECCLVSYPERLALHRTALPDEMRALVGMLAGEILPSVDRPFALFGHSMGGQVAYQFALDAAAAGGPQPVWVGISGFEAPCRARRRTRQRSLHLYGDAELRQHLAALGGTPREALQEDAWMQFASLIRKDLRLFERWQFDPASPTLQMPLSAFVGDSDPLVGAAGCSYWEYFTHGWQGLHVLPGNHFYFLEDPQRLANLLVEQLQRHVDRRAA